MSFAELTGVDTFPIVRTVSNINNIIVTSGGKTVRLSNLSAAGRRDVAWYDFDEEGVENIYDRGAATESIINVTTVSRTFPAKTLKPAADQKAFRYAELDRYADTVAYGGMIYSTQNYATDNLTLTYHGLVGHTGLAAPANIRDMDGVLTVVNPAQYRLFADAISEHVSDTINNRDVHSAAIDALTDPQEIVDYDITTGWPVNP